MTRMLEYAVRPLWQSGLAQRWATGRPIVLMYHGIPRHALPGRVDANVFERQILFLQEHFEFVSWEQYVHSAASPSRRVRILLTFDDGYANNAAVAAPILQRHGIPAVFFVCRRHAQPGRYLWQTYLDALQSRFAEKGFVFRGRFRDLSPGQRGNTRQQLHAELMALSPHPQAIYEAIEEEFPALETFLSGDELHEHCDGMSEQQLADLTRCDLFRAGVHTCDHALLSRCSPAESYRQLRDCRDWIEAVSGRRCPVIAYPCGDYDHRVLAQVAELGFEQGFAVEPKFNRTSRLEVPRIGIYRPSLDVLAFKTVFGHAIRRFGLKAG